MANVNDESDDSQSEDMDNLSEQMKLLCNVKELMKWSNATPFRCSGQLGYVCSFCDDQYLETDQLKQHTIDLHSTDPTACFTKTRDMTRFYLKMDITELHCVLCTNEFETLDEIMQHLQEDHDMELYMEVKKYMVPFKFDSDVFRCFICHNKYNTFKGLLEHMNVHCRNFVCKVCGSGFITRTSLVSHEKNHESGSFTCKFCEQVFSTLPKKKYHEKSVHCGTFPNKCSYCNECFRDYHKKITHLMEVHGVEPKRIDCHECDRSFKTQKAYMRHTKRCHLLEKRFQCTLCEMNFFTSSELKMHTVKHTGTRNFQCDVCLKSYGRKSSLQEHMKIHRDDRRHKCVHCGMAFVQKCSWRAHMRAKHGEEV
ncbi:uncharacterized protein [Epargyreus clarus]|uniref:uncharacterized protein isoform X2 n=1 Tax=Epargyreus clarus TaxID=520877 RepID=UPI003C2D675F